MTSAEMIERLLECHFAVKRLEHLLDIVEEITPEIEITESMVESASARALADTKERYSDYSDMIEMRGRNNDN